MKGFTFSFHSLAQKATGSFKYAWTFSGHQALKLRIKTPDQSTKSCAEYIHSQQ